MQKMTFGLMGPPMLNFEHPKIKKQKMFSGLKFSPDHGGGVGIFEKSKFPS
jgi:hypothetical protein